MDTVVDEENKILFCGVPKAATTVLKRMFLKMEFPRFKNVELDDIRAGKDGKLSNTHGQDLRSLEDYSVEKRKQILQSYYKVRLLDKNVSQKIRMVNPHGLYSYSQKTRSVFNCAPAI